MKHTECRSILPREAKRYMAAGYTVQPYACRDANGRLRLSHHGRYLLATKEFDDAPEAIDDAAEVICEAMVEAE